MDKADFARAVGVNPTTYRAYENGQNGFAKLAATFARKLGVSAEWLLEGGPAPQIGTVARVAPAAQAAPSSIDSDDIAEITALDLSLSMGPGTLIEEFVESEPIKMSLSLIQSITRTPSDRLRLVRGIGDSMEPTLRSSDRVMVDINEKQLTRISGIYWINRDGAHGIKRLRPAGKGRVTVISDNPGEDNYDVDAEEIRIEGRVIWFARDL